MVKTILLFTWRKYIGMTPDGSLLFAPRCSFGQVTLRWRHNGCDSVSNHQPYYCLLNSLFRRRSKKTSKLCVTGLCPVTRKMFPFDDVTMRAICLSYNNSSKYKKTGLHLLRMMWCQQRYQWYIPNSDLIIISLQWNYEWGVYQIHPVRLSVHNPLCPLCRAYWINYFNILCKWSPAWECVFCVHTFDLVLYLQGHLTMTL